MDYWNGAKIEADKNKLVHGQGYGLQKYKNFI